MHQRPPSRYRSVDCECGLSTTMSRVSVGKCAISDDVDAANCLTRPELWASAADDCSVAFSVHTSRHQVLVYIHRIASYRFARPATYRPGPVALTANIHIHHHHQVRKYGSISSTIRDILHWLPILQRVEFKTCVLVYNCLYNISPSYLSSMRQPVSVNPGRRCLRSAARGDLVVPATRTVRYGPRSFAVAGSATWNSLPASLRDDQLSVAAFRRLLKTELFTRAYDSSLARS